MDIEEFVKDVLHQVTRSVNDNVSGGKTTYSVDSNGISFDLAVMTTSTKSDKGELSGGLRVKVIGAEGSRSKTNEETKEQSSRVKFKVFVYSQPEESGVVTHSGGSFYGINQNY